MIANYHTHTWRCMHAEGTEREYVEAAIRGGLQILGFSDHAPMPFPDGYEGKIRMRMNQLEDYVDTVLRLKEEYKADIEIHIGLEAEYFPALFERFLALIRPYPIEYLLLGQHYLDPALEDCYTGRPTEDEQVLARYCRRCMEALDTDRFAYVAHPDLIHYVGEKKIYRKWMRELCVKALEKEVPLEINLLGQAIRRHYPRREFWEIAGEVGNKVILGSDAHRADMVCNPGAEREAKELARACGLQLIDMI